MEAARAGRSTRTTRANDDGVYVRRRLVGGTPVWLHSEVPSATSRSRSARRSRTTGALAAAASSSSRASSRMRRSSRITAPRPLAADALRRLRRADALGHRRGRDDVRALVHDERRPRHARPRDRLHLRLASRGASRGDPALQRDLRATSWVPEQGQADIVICGVFAPTDHLFFHTGWGCMSADLVLKDGGTIIYTSPSPGVSTAIGDFPGLALMDLMKPYMPPTRRSTSGCSTTSTRARSRCGRAASGCRSTR